MSDIDYEYAHGVACGELFNLRTKLAAETKRAQDAEAQRDKLADLLREMGYGFGRGDYPADFMMSGDVRYELLEAIDAALAEMENQGDRDGGDIIDALNDGRAV